MSEFIFFKIGMLQKELNELLEEREYLEAMATKVTPSYKSSCVQESEKAGGKIESYVVRLDDVNKKIRAKTEELEEVEYGSNQLIDKLDDVDLRRLIKLRFIQGKTWKEISDIFGGSGKGYGENYIRIGMKKRAFRLLKNGSKSNTK